MSTCDKDLRKYYQEIKHTLSCSRARKKEMLNNLKTSISSYQSEYPETGISDIFKKFGTPQEISWSYFYTQEEGEQYKRLNTYSQIRKWAFVILTILLVGFAGFYAWGLQRIHESTPAYIEENIELSEK